MFPSVEDFAEKVSVEQVASTRMLRIRDQDSDSQMAQNVVANIAAQFMELSANAYTQARQLLIERGAELEAN